MPTLPVLSVPSLSRTPVVHPRVRCPLWPALLLPLALCLTPDVQAQAIATRGPVPGTAAPNYLEGAQVVSGAAALNAAGASETFAPGYQVTSRASADLVSGEMKGTASFVLAADSAAPLRDVFFDDFLFGSGVLSGGTPGSTVSITLQMMVHGSFSALTTGVEAVLLGNLYAGGYQSQLEFHQRGSAAVQVVRVGLAGGFPNSPPYDDALPVVVSSSASDLRGLARIRFDAVVGSPLSVQAAFGGAATPQAQGGVLRAGSGGVDAWGTSQLQLLLPDGVALTQADGVLASAAVVASAVPEPSVLVLWLAGLAGLGGLQAAQARRVVTAPVG
jgi:hypothetical protein